MKRSLGGSFTLPLLFAVLAAGATFLALNRPAPASSAVTPTVRVAIAARPIDAGSSFGATDVTFSDMATTTAGADAVHDLSELQNAFAAVAIPKGAVVRRTNLSVTPPGSHLAALIPTGMVAVSIAVSDVINTGGFIVPGDRVDVLGIVSKEPTDTATIVLRDVQVLAVAQSILGQNPGSGDNSKPAATGSPQSLDSTVTLAVTIQDAQRLVQVDEVGKLRLALRRPAATTVTGGVPQTSN